MAKWVVLVCLGWVFKGRLSTTTANILGVFYIASKWLYETDK
ncbi:hypothetical protein [uncultured Gammaproteobacteria bacterium]|uniref:Uncharacterized protein n=1 Tax=Bathymodiolus azoricus thioautotrophic gill symbiont TaxID=235205 RepID=A0ACA8ZTC7_9GAMM|nr:hypothetical protein AZO1586R_1186 [Bathymodiolus azoricus thioautotrophic gill symbiont]CAC9491435.1 hypothetical protein [uncultured Gammaproteobacteria bacterium]CAC9509429.1 hypothetical protein [uncultured Gammaproteobacteria bacterium]CAC9511106.1 hypothetical protein [uncultured Gammaproteobacteria bacterium]CAC9539967.1 hypothetical protein [uncultured Gammaproteobacteria bacterium]